MRTSDWCKGTLDMCDHLKRKKEYEQRSGTVTSKEEKEDACTLMDFY